MPVLFRVQCKIQNCIATAFVCTAAQVGDLRFTACADDPGTVELSIPPSNRMLSLSDLNLTAQGAIGQLLQVLKPAEQPLPVLDLQGCCLSSQSWHPGSELLQAVTRFDCTAVIAVGSLQTAMNAGLQRMNSLCAIHFDGCDFSSGLPTALCECQAITHLVLSACQLTTLPQLACMPGAL